MENKNSRTKSKSVKPRKGYERTSELTVVEAVETTSHIPASEPHEVIVDLSDERDRRLSKEGVPAERAKRELSVLLEYNPTHAVAMINGKASILFESVNELGNPSYDLARETDFKLFHRNRTIWMPDIDSRGNVSWRKEQKAKIWLEHTKRRTVTRLVFKPTEEALPNEFNTFKGFGVEEIADYDPENPTKGCKLIYELWLRLLGVRPGMPLTPIAKFGLLWLAQLIQVPDEKTGVALVLRSPEGVGKGTFFNHIMRPILLATYLHVGKRRHLVGNFNSVWQGILLGLIDEAMWAGDKEGEGALKSLITEDTVTIEKKGQDPFELPNLARMAFASNEDWVVPAGKTARRFAVADCDTEMMQNKEYFDAVRTEAKNGGCAAWFTFLKNFDLNQWPEINLYKPPVTDALIRQKISSLRQDSFGGWLFERLYDGELEAGAGSWPRIIRRETLRESYNAYCDKRKLRALSAEELGDKLKTEFGVGAGKSSKDPLNGKRYMLYVFESDLEKTMAFSNDAERDSYRLAHFRGVFEREYFGAGYDWPTLNYDDNETDMDERERLLSLGFDQADIDIPDAPDDDSYRYRN